MSKRSMVTGLVVVVFLATVWVGRALSQEAGQERPAGERGARRATRRDPEQMRQRMQERMRELLGATEEDWKVLGPRVENVQTLSRQAGAGGGMAILFGRRARPGGRPEGAEETRKLTEVEKAVQQLGTTLDNEEAKPEEIKQNLTALRLARENAKQELASAQKELCELLTVRQEAQLVLMGTLD